LKVQKKGGRSASWRVQDVLNKMPKGGNGGGSCKGETGSGGGIRPNPYDFSGIRVIENLHTLRTTLQ
jgi:hypothetical protein